MNTFFRLTLIATALQLSACGGGSDSPANATAAPLTATIESSVSIESATQPKLQIASTSSVGNDAVYRVTTTFSNNSSQISKLNISQKLTFELGKAMGDLTIEIEVDPFTKKVLFLELSRKNTDSSRTLYRCSGVESCLKNLSFDPNSGNFSTTFNNLKLTSYKNNDDFLILNGDLKGHLSIPPQTLSDIPKTSRSQLKVDGKTVNVIALQDNPYDSKIDYIDALLEDGTLLSISSDQSSISASIVQKKPFFNIFEILNTDSVQFIKSIDLSKILLNETIFHDFIYQKSPNKTLSGELISTNPIAQFVTFSPYRLNQQKNNKINSYFSAIELINHNQKRLTVSDNTLTAGVGYSYTLINNTLQSIEFNSISSPDYVFERYTCARDCQGVEVSQNGYNIRFNNTVLTWGDTQRPEGYQPTLTLNGAAVFQGR